MRRILFVDDEPNVLDGIRRMLRPFRNEWMMHFASSPTEALEVLQSDRFDVVVTDMRMPGMDGAELLARVRDRYPHVVRIVLSGQADPATIMRSATVTHQHLTKPCDPEVLKATVSRACALQDLLVNESLRLLVSRLKTIPSLPALYTEVMQELQSPDPSTQRVGDIIARDPGMTGKILQIVNSSFFGMRRHVASPAQAAVLLGTEAIKGLVLSAQIFTQFDQLGPKKVNIDSIWQHSNKTGALARRIAQQQQADQKTVDHTFMAGLLHDVGKLILAAHYSDRYHEALALAEQENIPVVFAERQVIGATHAEVGAYLLGLWGLPDPVVEAVAWHHQPSDCPVDSFGPLTAVHFANVIMHEVEPPPSTAPPPCTVDLVYAERLGLRDELLEWRTLALRSQEASR